MNLGFALVLLSLVQSDERVQAPPARDDVVVNGKRLADEKLKKTIRTGFSAPGYRADATNREFDMAERAAKCAARGKIFGPSLMREVVDGVFNSSSHDRWQDRLVQQTASCGAGAAALQRGGAVMSISEASTGEEGILMRGAVLVEALRRFAPDLELTRQALQNPIVVHRFVSREEPRAKLRVAADLRFFSVATCLVQRQPETSIKIVYEQPLPSGGMRMAIARMIEDERQCVGGAKTVAFDPTQFRVYLADALYRWAVAAKGTESLIPPDAD